MKYDEIVKYAKEKYPNAEAVVSVYTMEMLWVSEKLAKVAGYSQEELVDKNIRDIVQIDIMRFMSLISGSDGETQLIKTKSGKLIEGTTDVRVFMFNKEPYFVTFNSSFKPLKK